MPVDVCQTVWMPGLGPSWPALGGRLEHRSCEASTKPNQEWLGRSVRHINQWTCCTFKDPRGTVV